MFLFALTAPTMVVNAITMAAFRKHVLVSLIHTGETPPCSRLPILTFTHTWKN